MKRRNLLKAALALPATSLFPNFDALAAPVRNQVKITAVKAMQLARTAGYCLIKIETDAGLAGYGEAGTFGPMARARIGTYLRLLIGQDPLAIERHFQNLTSLQHPFLPHIPTISGIDMALWDLAGKITGLPVCTLMGGPFREKVRLYINTSPKDKLDPASCREWAERMKADPMGWSTFKIGFMELLDDRRTGSLLPTLSARELSRVERGFANIREALGENYNIVAHCHNEFDLPSATGIARAIEATKPAWLEDPMPVAFDESWVTLKRSTRVPILTGEKLEMPRQFHDFLKNQALDIIQPDLAFSGGITGCRKIADLAAMYNVPLTLHNVGSLIITMASVHFGAATRSFLMSENTIGQGTLAAEKISAVPLVVKQSYIEVPKAPGLGAELDPDALRSQIAPGEPWWG
jgi:galactonate dehydratase